MEVLRYQSANSDSGSLVAWVDFRIPNWGLNLFDCRLMRGRNGGFFIAFPSKKYEKDGETKYAPYFWFDKEVTERFQKSARQAIDEYVKRNQESRDEPPSKNDRSNK